MKNHRPPIPRVPFGRSKRHVTRVGLGGEGVLRTVGQEEMADRVIRQALVEGIAYFDSAREIIERLLAGHPQRPLYLTCRSELGAFYDRFGFRPESEGEMPPYFRRISRLAQVFFSFAQPDEYVLVMVKE